MSSKVDLDKLDANELGAKLIKAELMDDTEMVVILKAKLEVAQQRDALKKKEEKTQPPEQCRGGHDRRGHQQHHHGGHRDNRHHGNEGRHQQHHHRDRDRQRGDEKSRKEAAIDPEGQTLKRHFRKQNADSDDEDEVEDDVKEKRMKQTTHASVSNDKQVEHCQYCFENAKKHLIVSIGKHAYLSLPHTHSLVENCCLIMPIQHQSSSVTCDEEVWNEIMEFKRALIRMFEAKRIDCIFIEKYSADKRYSHMIIECVPLYVNVSNMAPIYFKKAIMESESEWAENKSIVDLKKQPLRKTIPRNMPYFAVNFGLEDGYAHIIENPEAFPDDFATEIIGGILDMDPLEWRRAKPDNFERASAKVLEFLKWWEPHDFNKNNKAS